MMPVKKTNRSDRFVTLTRKWISSLLTLSTLPLWSCVSQATLGQSLFPAAAENPQEESDGCAPVQLSKAGIPLPHGFSNR
jgi:hypothetical protein